MDQQILASGAYEPAITAHLISELRPGDVFWDVGANAGVHALSVKASRADVTVIAFEPSPAQFSRLRHNAAINNLDVLTYCVAIAGDRGYHSLSVVDVGNSGLNSLRPWAGIHYAGSFPCWCDTVDDLVRRGTPTPNVMKVDVEGGEVEVFAGMPITLADETLRSVVFESRDGPLPALVDAGFLISQLGALEWAATRSS